MSAYYVNLLLFILLYVNLSNHYQLYVNLLYLLSYELVIIFELILKLLGEFRCKSHFALVILNTQTNVSLLYYYYYYVNLLLYLNLLKSFEVNFDAKHILHL